MIISPSPTVLSQVSFLTLSSKSFFLYTISSITCCLQSSFKHSVQTGIPTTSTIFLHLMMVPLMASWRLTLDITFRCGTFNSFLCNSKKLFWKKVFLAHYRFYADVSNFIDFEDTSLGPIFYVVLTISAGTWDIASHRMYWSFVHGLQILLCAICIEYMLRDFRKWDIFDLLTISTIT